MAEAKTQQACACSGQCGDLHEGLRCAAPDGATIMRVRAEPWRFVVGCYESRGTPLLPSVRVRLAEVSVKGETLALCQRCRAGLGRGARSAAKEARRDVEVGQGALALGGGQ